MRQQMLGEGTYDFGIFIGGMEGVIDEFMMFRELQPRAEALPIASTGAAASRLYQEFGYKMPELETELTYPTLFRRLLRQRDRRAFDRLQ